MLCFLLSAGGSAVFKAIEITKIDPSRLLIVSDRKCEALSSAKERGIEACLIEHNDIDIFSNECAHLLSEKNVKAILLQYSKLVGPAIYDQFSTYNVHPSLLPSFPGLEAEKQALNYGALFQGASLHKVDEGVDTGELVSQIITPTTKATSMKMRKKLSYIHKTILTTYFIYMYENMKSISPKIYDFSRIGNTVLNPGFENADILQKLNSEIEKETYKL